MKTFLLFAVTLVGFVISVVGQESIEIHDAVELVVASVPGKDYYL